MSGKNKIGTSLIWLVLVGVLPIVAFSAGMAWLFVDRQQQAIEDELKTAASALGVAVDRELQSEITAMQVLTIGRSSDRIDLADFLERSRLVMAEHPAWLDVALVDPRSHLIVEGILPRPAPAPTSSDPAAVDKVVATGKSVIVGAFAKGKIVDRPMILLMAPITRGHEVRYVMAVVLDQSAVSSIFQEQHMAASWTGAVIDAQMRLAGRSRNPEQFVGKQATPTLADRIVAAESGLFAAFNQEGNKVYTVFSRSPLTGWSVAIGVPASEVEDPIRRTVLIVVASGVGLIILGLVLAGILGRAVLRQRHAYEAALFESRENYRLLIECVPVPMALVGSGGELAILNRKFIETFGYLPQDLPTLERWWVLAYPDEIARTESVAAWRRRVEAARINHTEIQPREVQIICKSGNVKIVSIFGVWVTDQILTVLEDITERKLNQQRIEQLIAEQKAMLENHLVGIVKVENRMITWANPAFEKMLGYAPGELANTPTRQNYPSEEAYLSFGAAAYPLLNAGKLFRTQVEHVRKDGQRIWVDVSGAALDPDCKVSLWGFIDITDRVRLTNELRELARTDTLTGLANRRALIEAAEAEFQRCKRFGSSAAVLMIDIDNFKQINDTYGHETGDRSLVALATTLKSMARSTDIPSRYGGEEFVFLLVGTDLQGGNGNG